MMYLIQTLLMKDCSRQRVAVEERFRRQNEMTVPYPDPINEGLQPAKKDCSQQKGSFGGAV